MNFLHLIFDILLLVSIVFLTIYAYKHRFYLKLFDYLKIVLFITISANLAPSANSFFHKAGILLSDTYTIGILISFTFNFFLLLFTYKSIFKILNHLIKSQSIKILIAKIVSFIEAILITTLFIFLLMQIKPIKSTLQSTIIKSYSYPLIKKFYMNTINKKFSNLFMNNDSKVQRYEAFFKTIK